MSETPMAENFNQSIRKAEESLAMDRPREALAELVPLNSAVPGNPEVLCGIGRASIQLGDSETALQVLDMALEKRPDLVEARNARGVALHRLNRLDEAENDFRRVVEAAPGLAGGFLNLANVLVSKFEYDEARVEFARSLELDGENPTAIYNLGLLDLLMGNFDAGWNGYEMRSRADNLGGRAAILETPRWTGVSIADGTLLIQAEQGLGDIIQFARFLPKAAARVGRLVFQIPDDLIDLFSDMAQGVELVGPRSGKIPEHDAHLSLLSLPRIFGTRVDSVPWSGAYLRAAPEKTAEWRDVIRGGGGDAGNGVLHVGLVWAGNPNHPRDKERSIPLKSLAPLLAVEGVSLHALQIGPAADDLQYRAFRRRVTRLFEDKQPMTEVAAAISALDLVIGVDTSLVHLAGALARPVWTLITHVPDWRWLLDRGDTPWYPTMRLFRQRMPGDWPGVIEEVARALQGEAATRRSAG